MFVRIITQSSIVTILVSAAFVSPDFFPAIKYVDNIASFINLLTFFIMLYAVVTSSKDFIVMPKKPKTELDITMTKVYYGIVILTCIAAGWFFSAIVWIVLLICVLSITEQCNKLYYEKHPPEEKGKSLKELIDE